jgi:hypothetical protein
MAMHEEFRTPAGKFTVCDRLYVFSTELFVVYDCFHLDSLYLCTTEYKF